MNTKHLGDSYDLVKRTLIGWLGGAWAAHPMLTSEMEEEDRERLRSLLGVRALLSNEVLRPGANREEYLRPAQEHAGHLFLDPDTGVLLKPRKDQEDSPMHVFGDELLAIVHAPRRHCYLTLVYDQSFQRGEDKSLALRAKLAYFGGQRLSGAAYASHACFILLAANQDLLRGAVETLKDWLPEDRLLEGDHPPSPNSARA